MAQQKDSALSQAAIDALLAGGNAANEAEEQVAPSAEAEATALGEIDVSPGDHDPADENEIPHGPGSGSFGGYGPKDVEPEAATKSIANELNDLARRVSAIEQGLNRIDGLEKQIHSIRKSLAHSEDIDALRQRLSLLEKGARNTPAFNLYEKVACPSCGISGAAQVKTRCPGCGKEGWFGRRTSVESPSKLVSQPEPASKRLPKPVSFRADASRKTTARRAA